MDKTLFALYKYQSHSFKGKCVFMSDNAHSRVSKFTCEFFKHEAFTREAIMEWLPSSPDMNPIENL